MKNQFNRTVIVQCRLSSTRLPGKALKKIRGKTVLSWALSAMRKVNADRYFVATDEASYEQLKPVCLENGFECFAGDLNDVLKRFCDLIKTLEPSQTKTIIRATADNPFLFYEAAEDSACEFEHINQTQKCDYLTYSGLPHGSGVEIFSGESLLKAAAQTDSPYNHEHVGPSLYNHKENFDCRFIPAPKKYNFPELRTTIDTYSDFLRAQQIAAFTKSDGPYTCEQILSAAGQKLVQNPVVLVPSVQKGHGTGHLRRCLSIAAKSDFFVYIPDDATLEEIPDLINEYKNEGVKDFQIISQLPDESYAPVICTDSFKLTKNQLEQFDYAKKIISIDEGSEFSDFCDYLLDVIPSAVTRESVRKANFFNPDFIQKPKNVRKIETPFAKNNEKKSSEVCGAGEFKKILVCVGGEDPSGFTQLCANNCATIFPDSEIDVISSKKVQSEKINFLGIVPNLREKLFEYDLVITHYGLTAYEAMWAGCAVILLPTTELHKTLAKNYGFAFVDDEKLSVDSIKNALCSPNLFPQKKQNVPEAENIQSNSLTDFIEKIAAGTKITCPVCTLSVQNAKKSDPATESKISLKNPDKIIARNLLRTYRRCSCCGMIYLSFSAEPEKSYHKAYFFEEYKNQYGKTYKEDFENIKSQCLRRTDEIKSLIQQNEIKTSVLDIGCAYGPFLSAAYDKGFSVFGTDISEDAVDYVKNTLNFPACVSAFPDFDPEKLFVPAQNSFSVENAVSDAKAFSSMPKNFDCVTMWYVIEHFRNLNAVLTKVSSLVKKGGIFAFSTPSGEGVSATTDSENFYKISPSDHFTLWEPSKADAILSKFGFKVEKIVSTGHHPERFPQIKKSGAKKGSPEWNQIEELSHKNNLGDTVEIYCRKIK